MIKYTIYVVYNFFYEAVSVVLILYAETYLNGFLIPDKFMWNKNGTKRDNPVIWGKIEDGILLCFEGALLLLLLYYINKLFLTHIIKANNFGAVLNWTIGVFAFCSLVFILSILFGFYFPLP